MLLEEGGLFWTPIKRPLWTPIDSRPAPGRLGKSRPDRSTGNGDGVQQRSPEQSRDMAKLNDPETVQRLKAKAPEFDWPLMLKTAGLEASPQVLMTQNTAVSAMGKLLVATPLAVWKEYLAYRFASDHATFLPNAFDEARDCPRSVVIFAKPARTWRCGMPKAGGRWAPQ